MRLLSLFLLGQTPLASAARGLGLGGHAPLFGDSVKEPATKK
jgi:hypothetical protein